MPQDSTEPVYVISVAAKLVRCHPQTLRMYEREGLLSPARTKQKIRLYSEDDLDRVRQIRRLTQDLGVNIAGVAVILDLLDQIRELQEENVTLQAEQARLTALVPSGEASSRSGRRGRGGRQARIVEIE
ncbi:MAG: heat shock protein transcriptional repressor HspR [Armatimonadota bacterium]